MIDADSSGGDLSSDGGLMLVRQVDQCIGLMRMAAGKRSDPRECRTIRPLGQGDVSPVAPVTTTGRPDVD